MAGFELVRPPVEKYQTIYLVKFELEINCGLPREEMRGYLLGVFSDIPRVDLENVVLKDSVAEVWFYMRKPPVKNEQEFKGWIKGHLSRYLNSETGVKVIRITKIEKE